MDMSLVGERGARVRFPPPLVFAMGLAAGLVADRYAFPLVAPVPRPIGLAGGCLVIALGVSIVASARLLFHRTGQSPIPWKPSPELLLSGPYRFTRNPMYLGVTLIQAGLGLALDNLWITAFAPLALLAVHFIAVLPEEAYLTEKFGERYREYQRSVGRYL